MQEAASAPASARSAEVEQADLFEYTRYAVKTGGGLSPFSKRHVTHFDLAGIRFQKSYYYSPATDMGQGSVLTKIFFTNSKSAGLGFTLPRGSVKIYTAEDAAVRLIGESRLERMLESEEVKILPGSSRDIKVVRTDAGQKKISDKLYERTIQFGVKNTKKEPVRIEIEEPMYGFWEIKDPTDQYRKNGTRSISFDLDIAPGADRSVTFTVQQKQ